MAQIQVSMLKHVETYLDIWEYADKKYAIGWEFGLVRPSLTLSLPLKRGSQPKISGLFVAAGGQTAASLADRLFVTTQQAFAHTSKKQENDDKKCSDWKWAKEHPGEWSWCRTLQTCAKKIDLR